MGRDRPNNGDAQASVPCWAQSRSGSNGRGGDGLPAPRLRRAAGSASNALAAGMGASYA